MISVCALQTQIGRQELRHKLEAMEARLLVLQNGKISKLIGDLWNYRRVIRMEAFICDMIIVLRMKVTKH
jgi:hypothetical protein